MSEHTETSEEESGVFVDTPMGLFTASGLWFHTSRSLVAAYASPVLAVVSLPTLLHQAEVWIRSPLTLALWMLPLLLLWQAPLAAAFATLVFYIAWSIVSPMGVSLSLISVIRVLALVPVQLVLYVVVLSYLGQQGAVPAVVTGLAGFILLRWGAVSWAIAPLLIWPHRWLYSITPADQVLRSCIVQHARRHQVALPELDAMEARIIEIMNHKRRR